jgi:hypothetical protein
MPQGRITPFNQMTGHMTKLERRVRKQVEADEAKKPKTTPKHAFPMSKVERKIFNNLVKLNGNFTEADGYSLSILTKSMYRFNRLNARLDELEPTDERSVSLEKRIHAYDKSMFQHMTCLCIPFNQRLSLSNDMAKLIIEERKLEQMEQNGIPQEVNPLLALLEEDDDEYQF